MWQEGTSGVQVDGPDAVEGMNNIKADRWRSPCGLCGRTSGAVVKCNYGHGQVRARVLWGLRAVSLVVWWSGGLVVGVLAWGTGLLACCSPGQAQRYSS